MNKVERAEMERQANEQNRNVYEYEAFKEGFQAGLEVEKARSAKLVEALMKLITIGPFEYWPQIIAQDAIAEYEKEGGGDE